MNDTDLSCEGFLDKLASKEPAPGGGGAAALAGALAAALCSMVGNLTVGKKKYADVEEEIKAIMEKSETLRERLTALVAADAEAFRPLARAYSLPSGTEEEKRIKDEIMEKCLRDAAVVPLEIMRACAEVISLTEDLAVKGSRLAVSDAAVAAQLAKSALLSAELNVFINTKSMKDREYARELNSECCELKSRYIPFAERVFENVEDMLR